MKDWVHVSEAASGLQACENNNENLNRIWMNKLSIEVNELIEL